MIRPIHAILSGALCLSGALYSLGCVSAATPQPVTSAVIAVPSAASNSAAVVGTSAVHNEPAPFAESGAEPPEAPDLAPVPAAASGRPWMGIEMRQSEQGGVFVDGVFPASPAAMAGLQAGDRLLTVADQVIVRPTDVHGAVGAVGVGQSVKVTVQRDGQQRFMRVQLTHKPDSNALMRAIYVGKPAPSITPLQTVQGSLVPSLNRLQGQVVVLEFWATWCVACRALGPTLNRWHEELGARGVSVLAATTEPHEEVARAIPQLAMRYPVFVDPDGDVTMAYRASALPTMFLIDSSGIVQEVIVGFDPPQLEVFREKLAMLIEHPR